MDGSHILVATGRTPAIDNLGLAAAEIRSDAVGIVVDGNLRTTNRRVYAIGDAIAGPALAGRAERQGRAAVRSILYRLPRRDDDTAFPPSPSPIRALLRSASARRKPAAAIRTCRSCASRSSRTTAPTSSTSRPA